MVNYNFVALPKIYKYLSGNELKVFVTMFDEWSQMKNNDGWYYRGWKELRQDTGLSNDALNNALNGLYSKNLLRKSEYPKKEQKANEYQINMEVVVSLSKIPYSENRNYPTPKIGDTYSENRNYPTPKNGDTYSENRNYPTPKNGDTYSENRSTSKNKKTKNKEINNTTGNNTNSIQLTTGNKKKKSIKKEKENEMNDNGMNGMNVTTNEVKRNEVLTSKQECISTCFGFLKESEEVTTGNTTSTEDIENMRIVQTNDINTSNEEVDAASNQTIKPSLKSNIEDRETKLVQPNVTTGKTDFNECKLKTSINSKSITVSGSNSVAEETNNSITSTQVHINNNFNADSKKDSITSTQKQFNEGSIFSENCPKSLTPPNCATPPLSLTKEELVKRLYILHEVGAKEKDIHELQNVCTEIKQVVDQLKTMSRKMYLRAVQDTTSWAKSNNFDTYELISVVNNLILEIEKQQKAA